MKRHKLFEGFFDDDLFNNIDSTAEDVISDQLNKEDIKEIDKILTFNYFRRKYRYYYSDKEKPSEEKIYTKVDNNSACFYYNTINNGIYYISSFNFDDTDIVLRLINKFSDLNITYVYMDLQVVPVDNNYNNNILDFKDILFASYNLEKVIVRNIVVDFDTKNNLQYLQNYMSSKYGSTFYTFINLKGCYLTDTILINNAKTVTLDSVYNINDFSFIKKVDDKLEIYYKNVKTLPKCNSLQGIPDGNYTLTVEYKRYTGSNNYENMPLLTLKGIHNNLTRINYQIYERPWNFLYNFSFEGLTMDILPKFNFSAHNFSGLSIPVNVQIGPYKIQVKALKWHPTKPQYETIIKTNNWFLDCYKEKEQPHKEYQEVKYDETDSEAVKQWKKVLKFNQLKEDAKEDLDKMIKNIKSKCHEKDIYYGLSWKLYIINLKENGISYRLIKRWGTATKFENYDKFIRLELLNDDRHWRIGPNENDKLLKDIICTPVQNARQRILKKRKEQEKLERLKQKELNKKSKQIQEPEDDFEEEITPVKTPKITDVLIVDYSDKSIAVIGNTYPIKDLLKELGALFNKRLMINGQKTVGWILSKKKKSDVENILY